MLALEQSIEKWQAIVDGEGEDRGTSNCALCREFFDACYACPGCPVSRDTGMGRCGGTPYDSWIDHHEEMHDYILKVLCPECQRLAQAELDYLIELRVKYPDEEQL